MEHLAPRLAEIPGVEVVTLGGSRAAGTAHADSDWDFGLYYRTTIDPDDVRALGLAGEVFAPHEWGIVPNGGAWLEVDGVRVDLVYRDLATVEAWTNDAEAGRFRVFREVGYVAGAPTYSYPAELAINRHLVGTLPRPPFPDALRTSAPQFWRRLVDGALKFAVSHARRGDPAACAGNLSVAALCEAHARMCERGEWYLNEKDLLARAGLARVQPMFATIGDDAETAVAAVGEVLQERGQTGTSSEIV
jgi:predicted nucleotidyltransferase